MLKVTPEAKILLTDFVEQLVQSDQLRFEGLRMVRAAGPIEGYTLRPDVKRLGDETHRHAGRIMLLVGQDLASELDGRVLDADTSVDGTRHFTITEEAEPSEFN